jgi:hypothetical protein
LSEMLAKALKKKMKVQVGVDENKQPIYKEITRAEAIADALTLNACGAAPGSVAAFKAILEAIEPLEEPTDRGNFDIAREVLILMMEREKHMEVRDI